MSIERELQKNYQEVFYPPMPEPEVQVAAGPTDTVIDVSKPAFTMPGMGKRSQKSEVGQNLPVVAADVAAGGLKGIFSGVGGFGGDIEALYQGVKGVITRGGDETALDAFLRGMAEKTILPTSDEVSKWLDKNIGPVVPAGANMSPEMIKARQAGANAGEFAGQFVADPFAAIGAGKAIVKGAKALPKNLPVGMSTQAVDGMEGVLQPAAKAAAQPSDIGFYSAVEQAALNIQRKSGTGQAMLNDITKGQDVKLDEVKWIGLDDFLKGKKNVTREEVQQFIAANKVDVQEVQFGNLRDQAVQKEQDAANKLVQLINAQDGSSIRLVGTQGKVFSDEALYALQDGTSIPSQFPPEFQSAANNYLMAYEAAKGASNTKTKFGAYTLPGGDNYREILLTMPFKEPAMPKGYEVTSMQYDDGTYRYFANTPTTRSASYKTEADAQAELQRMVSGLKGFRENLETYKSSHFEQPNILAHIRVNDRVDSDGKKMLLVEEVQSDWHQAGRDKGYGPKTETTVEAYYLSDSGRRISLGYGRTQEEAAAAVDPGWKGLVDVKFDSQTKTVGEGVPDAPMKDTWYQLALKRVLKYAADNGYERVGLTTGKQQAERFDLSRQVDHISYQPTEKGFYINIMSDGMNIQNGDYSAKELENIVGKEITQKMIAKEGKNEFDPKVEPDLADVRRLEGGDLQVGGEGMKKYYDEVYPQFLAKYGKKWGAKVGETTIPTDRSQDASGIPSMYPNKEPVRYIDITPQMKESVSKGQPLFSATGLATGAGAGTMATSQQEPQ